MLFKKLESIRGIGLPGRKRSSGSSGSARPPSLAFHAAMQPLTGTAAALPLVSAAKLADRAVGGLAAAPMLKSVWACTEQPGALRLRSRRQPRRRVRPVADGAVLRAPAPLPLRGAQFGGLRARLRGAVAAPRAVADCCQVTRRAPVQLQLQRASAALSP